METPKSHPSATLSLFHSPGTRPARTAAPLQDLQESLLEDSGVRDLELDRIAQAVAGPGTSPHHVLRTLRDAPRRKEDMEYRQAVTRDLWDDDTLTQLFADCIRPLEELTVFSRSATIGTHPLLESVWRLSELELYIDLVRRLTGALRASNIASEGLISLRDELDFRLASPEFSALAQELPRLRAGLKLRRSLTVGINLDDQLRPIEAALISVNDKPFEERQFLKSFFGAAGGNPYATRTTLHRTSPGSLLDESGHERLPLAPLFQELEVVLRSVLKPLAKRLNEYVAVNTQLFHALLPEIGFLASVITHLKSLESQGFRMTFPVILDPSRRTMKMEGLYNLRLAQLRSASKGNGDSAAAASEVVCNDITMDSDARFHVLTGPNGGGKTTFTQAVGMAVALAQAGLPIPARSAELSPVDRILTHFPVEEDYDDDLGRFEDEVRRLSHAFDKVTGHSLVLLNEPLTGTGPAEAVEIAGDVLVGLALAGVRGVFTTHLHELSARADYVNKELQPSTRIGSLYAEVGSANKRTYSIVSGTPPGSSHASDVARRFHIDLESLVSRVAGPDRSTPA